MVSTFRNKLLDTVAHLLTEEKSAQKAIMKLDFLKTEETWEENFL